MTDWKPELPAGRRCPSQTIVSALARDIASGVLRPGQRLPPHRELAFSLGVAVATVTKAYAEARLRGYVRSVVGNGTFVIEPPLSERRRIRPDDVAEARTPDTRIDLSFNTPITTLGQATALADALQQLGTNRCTTQLLGYNRPWAGQERYRRAGAGWLGALGCDVSPDDVTVTNGAQHAACIALLSTLRAGDVLLSDQWVDPVAKLMVNTLGLELRGVPGDLEGMRADALDAQCRHARARALLCMPDHHSPTLAVMSEGRRRALAEVARRHDLMILEQAVYRPLVEGAPRPLCSFAPERSFFVSSFSKVILPGLRIGFLAAPPGRGRDLMLGLGATSWMAAPLLAEIAATWIETGVADHFTTLQRRELHARNQLVERVLAGFPVKTLPSGMHAWLSLPASWRADAFVREAGARGTLVLGSDAFAVGHANVPHMVRISLGGSVESHAQIEQGLTTLATLLAAGDRTAYIPG
jgi:DNA-binding transcriptional MocR family regulator